MQEDDTPVFHRSVAAVIGVIIAELWTFGKRWTGVIRMDMEFLRTPTKRETEVLKLTAAGCYQAEIAQILFISECTVQNHVRSTLHKLNARNSHQALKKMYDLKLLTVEDIPSLIDIVTSR